MRENRLSGSEGGGAETNRLSLPLYEKDPKGIKFAGCLWNFPTNDF